MGERGVLWTLTLLFLIGAAGRFEGPASMLKELRSAPPAVSEEVSPSPRDDVSAELAVLLDRLNPEEAAAFLAALPKERAEALLAMRTKRGDDAADANASP
ncbi:hypothetical protein [Parvularcula maris]|uniref:Uncharacterized protein n=1 Tax=Parvularcula maris TaxID=2965077 RepID=A0A9X2RIP9_9PROT|nr:hypothetical protein [Parvularcula maris]MCQ8184067.1 hypothetical protein [Parvularcula maris]